MVRRLQRIAVMAGVAALMVACGTITRIPPGLVPAGSYIGTDLTSVSVWNTANGQLERVLLPATKGRLKVNGLALQGKSLFVTLAAGPKCSGPAAGCGPIPDTCGAEVDRFDLSTGEREVVWRVGRNLLVADAQPSPDGTRLVAVTSPCVPSYFNNHLVIRDLAGSPPRVSTTDTTEVTIGAGLPRCHTLKQPRWDRDGNLIALYAPATGTTPWTGNDGTCTAAGPLSLIEMNPTRAQPGINALDRRPAPAGCTYESVAAGNAGVYAVLDCGKGDTTPTTGKLQHLDDRLRPTQTWPLDRCQTDSSLSINPTGSVLIAAYQSCTPQTVLDQLTGTTLHQISAHYGGTLVPDHLTW